MFTLELEKKQQENIYHIISHEFKMPITIIRSAIDVFERYDKLGKLDDLDLNNYIPAMRRNCDRLIKLIQNIVDIAYPTITTDTMNMEFANLPQIAELIINEIKTNEKFSDVHFEIKEQGEIASLVCNIEKIEQIFLNLISNSIKYSEENAKILFNFSSDEEYVIMRLENNSPPIAKDLAEKIFEPFFRNHNLTTEGTGLGLAIVKKNAEAHGGNIYLDTSFKKGCAFIMKLPLNLDKSKTLKQTFHHCNSLRNSVEIELSNAIIKKIS